MTTLAHRHFSTVEHIQKLRKANFTEQQAEVVAELIEQQSQTINEQQKELEGLKSKDLATRGDVRESELRLQKEIEVVRKEIAESSTKTIIWVAGLLGTFGVFFLGILAKGFHWI